MTFKISDHRLGQQQLTSHKSGKPFFTSDLSTNEYLLTKEAGCDPIGLVMGSSFYQIGFYRNWWGYRTQTGEVETLTQAQLTARELAVSRLQQEATMLGAHGVIGVRLQERRKYWAMGMVEFTAIGTAIRIPGEPTTKTPFTSDLSGQEFWQLRQAGYRPRGMVFGVCSYYIHSDRTTRNLMNQSFWNRLFGRGRQNQEMQQFTEGFQDARELAVLRLTSAIDQLGATGSVGMEIETSQEVINYQPFSLGGCLFSMLFVGIFPVSFLIIITGNGQSLWLKQFMNLLFNYPILPWSIVVLIFTQMIWNNFTSPGPCRDLLINFIATGTAITIADNQPPPSKTLLFIPLNK
jgi:uncharacterized protein YbjQ (UPF0145 family)